MDFVYKLYGNTYAVHVTVPLVGVATLNLALLAPPDFILFMVNTPMWKRQLEKSHKLQNSYLLW